MRCDMNNIDSVELLMEESRMTLHGQVRNGVVVFETGDVGALPDGTIVMVSPVGKQAAISYKNASPGRISQEQRDALLRLIGIWRTDQPPSDSDVERIVEEARMNKY